jgi:ankyrin repeat protein
LYFVLGVDNYTVLVNGGEHYADKVEELVKLLIDAETSLAFQEITGHSALTFACANASLPVLNCLVEHLPVCDFTHWRPSAEEWHTPLMAAVVQDRPEVVGYLLELLVDTSKSHPVKQWTPLFYAVSGLPEISCLLVRFVEHTISREVAILYVNRRDTSGATAFDIAVAGEFFEAARVLADYQPAFLAYKFPYGPESDCLMNSLGSAAAKRRQLFYLLDLIGPVNELPMVDNEGTTIVYTVCGIIIGMIDLARSWINILSNSSNRQGS